jgi:aldehyde dehydrogenase (NAD+)
VSVIQPGCMLDDQQAPLGGFKHSGLGRKFGMFGIESFLEPRRS